MAISAETTTLLITGSTAIGAGIGAFAKQILFRQRNGSTPLTKGMHAEICTTKLQPVIDDLKRGDAEFADMKADIKYMREISEKRHIELIEKIASIK